MICDNARPEMIADLQQAGYNAKPCTKYKGSVRDGINEVLKYNLKIVKGSRNTFDEVMNYLWEQMPNEKLGEDPAKSIDHAMDGGRYGLEAVQKNPLRVTDQERAAFEGLSRERYESLE
jgi:phage terminase large subunit